MSCAYWNCRKLGIIYTTYYVSRNCALQIYRAIPPNNNASDKLRKYIVATSEDKQLHLWSLLAILSPRVPLHQLHVRDVDSAASLLETVQYVEYEDLQNIYRPLHQFPSCVTVWAKLFDCNQPTSGDLIQLLKTLVDACGQMLILDLLKLVQGYVSATLEELHVQMPLDVFDSAFNWQIAIVQDIVCTGCDDFILIHYVGWKCEYDEWISVRSARIRLLRNAKGEIVHQWLPFEDQSFHPDIPQVLSCDFHNPKTGGWERCNLYKLQLFSSSTGTRIHSFSRGRDLAPPGIFTIRQANYE